MCVCVCINIYIYVYIYLYIYIYICVYLLHIYLLDCHSSYKINTYIYRSTKIILVLLIIIAITKCYRFP